MADETIERSAKSRGKSGGHIAFAKSNSSKVLGGQSKSTRPVCIRGVCVLFEESQPSPPIDLATVYLQAVDAMTADGFQIGLNLHAPRSVGQSERTLEK
jgi:hypothetical protein